MLGFGGNTTMESVIAAIEAQIAMLHQVKALLSGTTSTPTKRGPGRPKAVAASSASGVSAAPKKAKRRGMSPEGRARIAAAQKARWAKLKAGKK